MAQDYDSPRSKDEDEESLQALGKSSQNASNDMDDDENAIAEDYELEMPEFALRLQAKAGLTGLAQVYGKYNTTPYNKLQMALQYIASMGVVEDLKIMFATVKILFMPESTEGVADGQTTAMNEEKK